MFCSMNKIHWGYIYIYTHIHVIYIYVYICIHTLGRKRLSQTCHPWHLFLRGAWNLEKLQRCPNQIFHRDGGSLSLDSTRSRVTVSSFNEYHIRPYFVGIFPYMGLIEALYMVGTSNKSVPKIPIDSCWWSGWMGYHQIQRIWPEQVWTVWCFLNGWCCQQFDWILVRLGSIRLRSLLKDYLHLHIHIYNITYVYIYIINLATQLSSWSITPMNNSSELVIVVISQLSYLGGPWRTQLMVYHPVPRTVITGRKITHFQTR